MAKQFVKADPVHDGPDDHRKSWGEEDAEKKLQVDRYTGCRFNRDMWCYAYRNHTVSFTSKVYLRSDGKVRFHSLGNTTEWHGSWQFDLEDDKVEISFSYRRNEDEGNLKTTVVFKSCGTTLIGGCELWAGRDESQRFVTMVLLDKYRECLEHKCWHIQAREV